MNRLYGFSFYPEHCETEEELHADIKLIKDSGASVVRMGEFCWDQLEPKEGVFKFSILENAVNLLGEAGILSIICTPTSCPPSWLFNRHPEISYIDYRGMRRPFGARHSYCYNNEVYREYSARIAEKMAEVFDKNQYVIGFQIGNELAQESSGRCHCPQCAQKFRLFLKDKYKTAEAFNKACGTYFWGQSYEDFLSVTPPLSTIEENTPPVFAGYFDNPSLRLNYERFASTSLVEYADIQLRAIKKHSQKTVTTNSTGFGTNLIDYYDLYKHTDIYALDIYPDLFTGEKDFCELSYAFGRSIKQSDFWILEFAIGGGHGLWTAEGRLQPRPGVILLQVMHAFASGASLLTHFQYKTFRIGAEQLNYALLDADRVPRRRYFEFQKTAQLLTIHEKLLTSTQIKQAEAAIVFDYDALWSLKIKPIHHDFDYVNHVREIHTALRSRGYCVDIIHKQQITNKYKLIVLPTMFVCDDDLRRALYSYVENGGHLFSTFLTSVKNMDNVAYDTSLPAGLTKLFGMEVYEVEPVFENSESIVELKLNGKSLNAKNRCWLDEITLKTAESLGKFTDTYRRGRDVISANKYGNGTAYYCGTMLDTQRFSKLIDFAAQNAGLPKLPFEVPAGVTIIERIGNKRTYYYIFNFNQSPIEITIPEGGKNPINQELVEQKLVLLGFDFLCIEF